MLAKDIVLDIDEERFVIRRVQLAKSAAAIVIQSCYRGWVIRKKYLRVLSFKWSVMTLEEPLKDLGLPSLQWQAQDQLLVKYKAYTSIHEKLDLGLPEFPDFCAALIACHWKGYVTRQLWSRYLVKKKACKNPTALAHAKAWILKEFTKSRFPKLTQSTAAQTIQRAWRRYYVYWVDVEYPSVSLLSRLDSISRTR